MNKSEFLHRLEEQLAGLPPEEKRAAMEYYTEYLQEAGEAGEADVLQELGDPAEVAAAILGARASQTEAEAEKNAVCPAEDAHAADAKAADQPKSSLHWLLVLALLVVLSPLLLTLFSSFIGLVTVLLGVIVAGVGLAVAGVVVCVAFVPLLKTMLGHSLLGIGSGLLAVAVGLLLLAGGIWLCGTALPALVRWVQGLYRKWKEKGAIV